MHKVTEGDNLRNQAKEKKVFKITLIGKIEGFFKGFGVILWFFQTFQVAGIKNRLSISLTNNFIKTENYTKIIKRVFFNGELSTVL